MIDKSKLKLYLVVLALFLFVVSCNQDTTPVISDTEPETPIVDINETENDSILLTDEDIDNAEIEASNPDDDNIIVGLEAPYEVNENPEIIDLTISTEIVTQAVVSGAKGSVCYARHNPTNSTPWKLYVHDQATDTKTVVYSGNKEIQSVACSPTGGTVYFAMRQWVSSSSDYEIYKYVPGGSVVQLTANAVDNIDVSVSADGTKVAWVFIDSAGKHHITIRTYTSSGFSNNTLSSSYSQITPSISGDGKFVGFVRLRPSARDQVMVYTIASNSYKVWASPLSEVSDVSVADGASKVAWKSLASSGVTSLYTRSTPSSSLSLIFATTTGIDHPHLSAEPDYITYGRMKNGSWDVYMRKISTNQNFRSIATTAPVEAIAPYWQWEFSNSCVLGTGILGSCTLGP